LRSFRNFRELSERRRVEMREIYAKISEASIGVRGALKSYLTDIKEMAGKLSDNTKLEAEGSCEKLAGKDQVKVGQVKKVFGK
jgi:uncharacterized protein YjbJ (UPF0337 family)